MKDVLTGWDEIGKYLRIHPRTAQHYEHTRALPVHRRPGGGPKAPVFAYESELDVWLHSSGAILLGGDEPNVHPTVSYPAPREHVDLAVPVLDLITKIARDIELYRRRYTVHFDLRRSARGIQARIKYDFELCNATRQKQPYVQEVTIDDIERGYVDSMSVSAGGEQLYSLTRPALTKKLRGYSAYCGPEIVIESSTKDMTYTCHSSWVVNRLENDIWYNHMILPTIGIDVHTSAPPDFEITASFSRSDLIMKGEHIDIAWNKRH